jgi:hypothetical protein
MRSISLGAVVSTVFVMTAPALALPHLEAGQAFRSSPSAGIRLVGKDGKVKWKNEGCKYKYKSGPKGYKEEYKCK